jgi:KDO2-lipid IV(A) lauroyltransferase
MLRPVFRGIVRLLRWAACAPPHRSAMSVAAPLGRLFYAVFFWWRRTAIDNLARAFPEWTPAQVRQCARGVFVCFTKTAFEFLRSRKVGEAEFRSLMRIHGLDLLKEAVDAGRGVLMLAAHYDNWEWLGRRLAMEGLPVTVIARGNNDPKLEALVNETRAAHGLTVVDRRDVRAALRALKRGEVVGVLPDQNQLTSPVFVEFFGRPAATAAGPYELAARTGALVVHGITQRAPDDSHDAWITEATFPPPTDDARADAQGFMQAAATELERMIRERPEQWLWIHKRWRTQPGEERTGRGDD